jgi:catechol 2,3-dioxygenase-like lactoylglutathione lyase family enzyme
MTKPNGVNHLAIMTKDIKGQIEFFSQVLGMRLVAFFDMHGVPGGLHAFLELDGTCYFSLVQVPGVEDVESTFGVTHAGSGAGVSAPGTLQHLAFDVPDEDALLGLRDRLRHNGIVVFGPIDHGMCKSIYFAGPEGMALEAAFTPAPLDQRRWIDPEVAARAGMSADDLERFRSPAAYERPAEAVAQPGIDPTKPHLHYPPEQYAMMVTVPDDVILRTASVTEPPVPLPA